MIITSIKTMIPWSCEHTFRLILMLFLHLQGEKYMFPEFGCHLGKMAYRKWDVGNAIYYLKYKYSCIIQKQ